VSYQGSPANEYFRHPEFIEGSRCSGGHMSVLQRDPLMRRHYALDDRDLTPPDYTNLLMSKKV